MKTLCAYLKWLVFDELGWDLAGRLFYFHLPPFSVNRLITLNSTPRSSWIRHFQKLMSRTKDKLLQSIKTVYKPGNSTSLVLEKYVLQA